MKSVLLKIIQLIQNPYSKFGLNWIKVKKLKHSGYNVPGKIKLNNKLINYIHPVELIFSIKEIYIEESYNFSLNTEKEYKIIDCGANIGLSTYYFANRYKNSTILAYEPDLINFNLLKENLKEFPNVTIFNEAIGDQNKNIQFSSNGTQSSHIGKSTDYEVKMIRLKNLLTQKIDFLKIDVEGEEYAIIYDCQEELKNVNKMFVEYHGKFDENYKLTELLTIFNKAGFYFYIKEAANLVSNPYITSSKFNFDVQLNIYLFKNDN